MSSEAIGYVAPGNTTAGTIHVAPGRVPAKDPITIADLKWAALRVIVKECTVTL